MLNYIIADGDDEPEDRRLRASRAKIAPSEKEPPLEKAVRDILKGVVVYPIVRLYTRFLSTFFLASVFGVRYKHLLALVTMLFSFGPLGFYPYLVAIPWIFLGALGAENTSTE